MNNTNIDVKIEKAIEIAQFRFALIAPVIQGLITDASATQYYNTDLATHLGRYFTRYLPNECGSSPQTIDSYRYAFILFLEYMESSGIPPEKMTIADFTRDSIQDFLGWLESERGNSPATRNYRLAAMKGFVHYLKYEFPDYLDEYLKSFLVYLPNLLT